MDKLEELKSMLKELSPEEMEQLKSFITEDKTEETPTEEAEQTSETTESETSEELPAEEQTSEEPAVDSDETAPTEEEPVMEKVDTDEGPASEETETPETETSETTEETPATEDDALIMRKGVEPSPEETVATSENITADDGSEIPIDYKQIIEGQNAKIAALEAENASLKSRYEGAFGFSAKPSAPGKVNPLYDDAIDNIRFHK